VLLVGAGYAAVSTGLIDLSRFKNTGTESDISEEVSVQEFVAMVNEEGIEKAVFDKRFDQAKLVYQAQGVAFENEEDTDLFRRSLLEELVNEELMLQYGEAQGMTASEEEIESDYQQVIAQFPTEEELQKELDVQNFTKEDLRERISLQIIVRQIVAHQLAENQIEVTEEELRQLYDDAIAAGAEVGEFEEVKSAIEQQLLQQKTGQLMDELLYRLRGEGVIQILI